MKIKNRTCSFLLAGAIVLAASCPAFSRPQSDDKPVKPDNSKVNARDKSAGAVTAGQQKMNNSDRMLTAKIRKSVMADKTLSTYAHNVKIVSQDGMVTLKGPVNSEDEVKSIVAKAVEVTGSASKVTNEMSVKQ